MERPIGVAAKVGLRDKERRGVAEANNCGPGLGGQGV